MGNMNLQLGAMGGSSGQSSANGGVALSAATHGVDARNAQLGLASNLARVFWAVAPLVALPVASLVEAVAHLGPELYLYLHLHLAPDLDQHLKPVEAEVTTWLKTESEVDLE